MEKKPIIKIKYGKIAKRIEFPNDFNTLIQKCQELIPLNDQSKRYQFIEEKEKREITNQEDFQKISNEFIKENVIRITVNIVDKNIKYKNPDLDKNSDRNIVSNAVSINLFSNNKDRENLNFEENKEDEIENSMKLVLKDKMKKLEDKLVEELYNNLQVEISKTKIVNLENKNNEEEKNNYETIKIHKGIACNKCGKENIQGIRYKCAQCANFNLCENCEKNYIHDMKHIMIKIIFPIKNESEFIYKINRNISYKNQDFNYNLEPKTFILDKNDNINFQKINIKNIGAAPWRRVVLKCIEDKSDIIGEDCEINYNVNSGSCINTQIKFENLKNEIKPNKTFYYSFFQMFNDQKESFGNITKIKIEIKN